MMQSIDENFHQIHEFRIYLNDVGAFYNEVDTRTFEINFF